MGAFASGCDSMHATVIMAISAASRSCMLGVVHTGLIVPPAQRFTKYIPEIMENFLSIFAAASRSFNEAATKR